MTERFSRCPVTVVLPTYNAGTSFPRIASALAAQTAQLAQVLVIDSASEDGTPEAARSFGFTVGEIAREEFGHGRTRQYALEKAKTETVVFLTQDALLASPSSIETLVRFLYQKETLAAVCGRQLPYPDTDPIGAFARYYNYPSRSFINRLSDRAGKGIKTVFFSDSFAAYKKPLLLSAGGFSRRLDFGEDTCAAGRLLLAGYETGYCADAAVYHAHAYSLRESYQRYKAAGKLHKEERWLIDAFGRAEGEGWRYVRAEAAYLWQTGNRRLIPKALLCDMVKFAGYRAGRW